MPTHLLSSTSDDVFSRFAGGSRWREIGSRMRSGAPLLAFLFSIGCDRGTPDVNVDSLVDTTAPINPAVDSTATRATGWEADAGPYVILPTVDGGLMAGSLLRPGISGDRLGDTTGLGAVVAPGRIELFSRAGKVGVAQLSVEQSRRIEPECAAWPTARLMLSNGTDTAPWTAAFAEGRIVAIPLDSIEGMAPRDSAKLAADLTRLASALRDDTSSTFRGLPFVVLRAYRSKGDDAFIVATLIRRINQEDSPKEERLVMVVEAAHNDPSRWRVAWFERAAGTEEELMVAEPLLAFRARESNDIRLLFGRDDGVSLSAAVLSRDADGWKLQWESPASGCDI